jgi:Ser/Thr protein kinase RdoA (MazF antagonist)
VLGAGANVVIHLAPSPVVARVATLTAEMRGNAAVYLRRERDLCRALASRGIEVVTPTDLVVPGPHAIGDVLVLLLAYRRLDPVDLSSLDHADAVGRSFSALATALADLPVELSEGDGGYPWAEIGCLLSAVGPTTDGGAMDRIVQVAERLQATEPGDPWQLVHGDAHRVNVALSDGRVVWLDFEDANQRSLAWDLATLRRAWPAAGTAACRLLDVDPGSPSMRWHHELRELYALLWNLLYAQRHRKPVADRLRLWLANH